MFSHAIPPFEVVYAINVASVVSHTDVDLITYEMDNNNYRWSKCFSIFCLHAFENIGSHLKLCIDVIQPVV
jgi:hypothetical protein